MEFLNQVELRGVVGNVRTQNVGGKSVANFSLVTEYAFANPGGCPVIETTWHNVSAWSGDAIADTAQVVKGTKVHVLGRLRMRRYIDNSGMDRVAYEVVAHKVQVVS